MFGMGTIPNFRPAFGAIYRQAAVEWGGQYGADECTGATGEAEHDAQGVAILKLAATHGKPRPD